MFKAFALFSLLAITQASPATKVLGVDDVVLMREDGPVVMKKWDYQNMEDKRAVEERNAHLARVAAAAEQTNSELARRDCEQSTEVQVLTDTKFSNWDVVMSPVIKNTGAGATVSVTDGYSISNSIEVRYFFLLLPILQMKHVLTHDAHTQVSESVASSLEGFLTTTLSISVGESWTTSDSQTFAFDVPAGQYGVVVSNPMTRRVTGNVLSGCTDSPTSTPFQSDSYTSQTYKDLSWVTGVITICNSTEYPIPYCIGSGTHS